MKITRFEELSVWRKAKEISLDVYGITGAGAFSRDVPLRDQIRGAAVSIMSNIAEGFERYSRKDFRNFLSIARGSASEVRSQLHLAHALGYISGAEFASLYERCLEISRMLAALHASSAE